MLTSNTDPTAVSNIITTRSSQLGRDLPSEYSDHKRLAYLPTTLKDIRGKVSNIVDFGVFVDFGMSKVNGLIHRSQLGSEGFDGLRVGGSIRVDVITVDLERKRVGLKRRVGKPVEEEIEESVFEAEGCDEGERAKKKARHS